MPEAAPHGVVRHAVILLGIEGVGLVVADLQPDPLAQGREHRGRAACPRVTRARSAVRSAPFISGVIECTERTTGCPPGPWRSTSCPRSPADRAGTSATSAPPCPDLEIGIAGDRRPVDHRRDRGRVAGIAVAVDHQPRDAAENRRQLEARRDEDRDLGRADIPGDVALLVGGGKAEPLSSGGIILPAWSQITTPRGGNRRSC